MAFTNEQEVKLKELLAAYAGGKRLNELPVANCKNPFDLIIEVLDSDGETKQSKLAVLLPYIETQCMYGIEFDTAVSSPLCTRIGNTDLHKSLPIQSRMRGCLLNDNGIVVEYLNASNWNGHDLSGVSGQVMVEIPEHYRKFETEGTKRRAKISEYPLPGYHFVKRQYVSAFEASIERSTGKLCSIMNMAADFRGGTNEVTYDGKPNSLLGRPVTGMSRTDFRSSARKRGAGAQWNCNDYNINKSIAWLFYIEYATLNSQAAYTAQKDANGFSQGGLGSGATLFDTSVWRSFNGLNPFIPCGHTNSLNNNSGEVLYSVLNADGTVLKAMYANRYRGIENPFGHIWKWTDGIIVDVKSNLDGGTSNVYVCSNPDNYKDTDHTGYEMRGLASRVNGYATEMIMGEFGDILPAKTGGSDTTFWCDYYYTYVAEYSVLRGVLVGSGAGSGAYAGFGYANASYAPSDSNASFGSRLCFIPA
ncbi:MAG: hypothetical protein RSA98_07900 [Odoribacter sp.]